MSMHSQLYERSERLTVINGESSILNELFRIYTDCQTDGQTVESVSQSDIQLLSPLDRTCGLIRRSLYIRMMHAVVHLFNRWP